jgi:Protein of unknown function (DUF2938)
LKDVTFAIIVGLGATVLVDLWALLLKRVLGIPSLSYCLVGRWFCHMPGGKFSHASIAAAAPRPLECWIGWIAHYLIGVVFALAFVSLASGVWLARPTFMPALIFGVGTVAIPFLVMQPALGLGIAASKAPNPNEARLKSLITHAVFGTGLYATAAAIRCVLGDQ